MTALPTSVRAAEAMSLPGLVRAAASKLAAAESSAEVLEAREIAGFAYDVAKREARMARAKRAHDEVVIAATHAQADALAIESAAKRRLADEYDAAQDRGEVATGRPKSLPDGETFSATVTDIGLTHKQVHDARQLRDAEAVDPGVTRRALDQIVSRGEEPTRAALKREIVAHVAPAPKPGISEEALWLWGRLRDFRLRYILDRDINDLFAEMSAPMRADMIDLAPIVSAYLQTLESAR